MDKEYTLGELNYFRVCYITANIIRDGLQSVFKQEWDRVYGWRLGPWQDSIKNGQDFFNMESPKSRSKNKRFLSVIQNGDTNEWDCSCFFFSILFSDSLGPCLSPAVAVNVDDLRVFRNDVFAHLSQASIPEKDFQVNVKLVLDVFTALRLDTEKLQRVSNVRSFKTEELRQLREQIAVLKDELQAKPKSFMCLPSNPSHLVAERKSEVENIMQAFIDLRKTCGEDSIVTVYVSGNPGCGKSQIARSVGSKFHYEMVADGTSNSCSFVMTLNAASEQSILDSYYKFARELGITEYSLSNITGEDSKLKDDEKISHLKTLVSSKTKQYSSWLLICDNADELVSLRNCWPDETWGGCGKVLVTTQDSSNVPFADPSCRHISLSCGMKMDDALSLLRSISQLSCDDEEMEYSVVKALDFQPLAIACAALYVRYLHHDAVASHIASGNSTWRNYIKKLEMGKRRLTERIYERTNKSYPLSMTSAVGMATHKLVERENESLKYLVLCIGLGAPAPLDVDIVVNFMKKREPALDEETAAADIAKCSLLIPLVPDDSPRTLIKVHQVVHDVFKDYIFDNYSSEEVFALTRIYIETLSPSAKHNRHCFHLEFHILSKLMAPHLKLLSTHLKALSNWASCLRREEKSLFKAAFLDFGDICNSQNYLSSATAYFKLAFDIFSDDDDDSESQISLKATILNNLGDVYLQLGQFEKAKDHHERSLGLFENLNSTDPTPELADSFTKLGNVFFSFGQFEKAKGYFLKSLNIRKNMYGEEHATIADGLSSIGMVHSVLGDLQTAEFYFQKSYGLRKNIFESMHPRVADSLNDLGVVYSKAGQHEKAIECHSGALEMRKKLFFPDHLLIYRSYNNLGLGHKLIGQLDETRKCYESALRIREKTLDQDHPAVAGMLSNLGVLYMDLGELQKAKEFHQKALLCRRKVLGINLGLVLERCNEYDAAAKNFQQAVAIYTNSYPKTHELYQSAVEDLKRVSLTNTE